MTVSPRSLALAWIGLSASSAIAQPSGRALADARPVPISEATNRCLELDRFDREGAFEAAALSSESCTVTGAGEFAGTGRARWLWSLARRERLYEAGLETPDRVREFLPDMITEDELVVYFVPEDAPTARPVWYDRVDTRLAFLRPPRTAPLPNDDGALLVHRRCANGTAGCFDYAYRLRSGAVRPMAPVYVEQLAERLPEPWGTWKGIWLEPEGPRARAAVYVPGDPNCCASFAATVTLEVEVDTLRIDSLAVVPATGESGSSISPGWWIDPGRGFGHVSENTSAEELREAYGPSTVLSGEISIGEGFCAPGVRVFPGTGYEFEVVWADSTASRPAFARVSGSGGPWRTGSGVRLGTGLDELEEIRGGPVSFSGFGWDYGGRATWEEQGGAVVLELRPDPGALRTLERKHPDDPRVDALYGDRTILSDQPLVDELGIRVASIAIFWAEPRTTRYCEAPPAG